MGQRIEYFEKLQIQSKITDPLKIPLHSNIRWGSAYLMLDHSYKLRQVSWQCLVSMDIGTDMIMRIANQSFLKSADALYGPITTIRRNGRIKKKISWVAFMLTDRDWECVKDACDLLKVSGLIVARTLVLISVFRTRTIFNNTFHLNDSPHSSNCRPHGRRSETLVTLICTRMPLRMD